MEVAVGLKTVGNVHVPASSFATLNLAELAAPSAFAAFQLKVTSHSENTNPLLVIVHVRFTLLLARIPEFAMFK